MAAQAPPHRPMTLFFLFSRDPLTLGSRLIEKRVRIWIATAHRVRRKLLRSVSPVCVRAGKSSHPLLPSSFSETGVSRGPPVSVMGDGSGAQNRHGIPAGSQGNTVPGFFRYFFQRTGVGAQIWRAVRLPLRTARWMLCGSAQSPTA